MSWYKATAHRKGSPWVLVIVSMKRVRRFPPILVPTHPGMYLKNISLASAGMLADENGRVGCSIHMKYDMSPYHIVERSANSPNCEEE